MSLSDTDIVDKSIGILLRYGTVIGARLWCTNFKKQCFVSALRIFLFCVIVSMLILNMALQLLDIFSTNENGVKTIRFDTITISKFINCLWFLDGTILFIITNWAHFILTRRGFYNQCKKFDMKTNLREKKIRKWARITKIFLVIAIFLTVATVVGVVGSQLYQILLTIRLHVQLKLIQILLISLKDIAHTISILHSMYHGVLYCALCGIVRTHFRMCSDSMRVETGLTFSKWAIDKYHVEYGRIVRMARLLDKAFKFSCLSEMTAVIISTCLALYQLTETGARVRNIGGPLSQILLMSITFTGIVVPAIMLTEQAEKAKKWLHVWLLNYYQFCESTGTEINEARRHAYMCFMQYLNSADVGITIGSLAKLELPILLSIISVIITYFLVILQFTMPANCEYSFNNTNVSELLSLM